MKAPLYFALIALLSACIPIGIRGTSVVDAGAQRPAAALPSGQGAAVAPGRPAPDRRRA